MPAVERPPRGLEELLEVMLTGAAGERLLAGLEAKNLRIDGVLIADFACGHRDQPRVLTLWSTLKHLLEVDHPNKVQFRGHRLHTPVNVVPYDEETMHGFGPGLGRGPA
jgi:hypothetical protein